MWIISVIAKNVWKYFNELWFLSLSEPLPSGCIIQFPLVNLRNYISAFILRKVFITSIQKLFVAIVLYITLILRLMVVGFWKSSWLCVIGLTRKRTCWLIFTTQLQTLWVTQADWPGLYWRYLGLKLMLRYNRCYIGPAFIPLQCFEWGLFSAHFAWYSANIFQGYKQSDSKPPLQTFNLL